MRGFFVLFLAFAAQSGAAGAARIWTLFIKVCINSWKKLLFGRARKAGVRAGVNIRLRMRRLMAGFLQQIRGIVARVEQSKNEEKEERFFLPSKWAD